MIKQFSLKKINILDTFYCPHSPEDNCECRKPLPGMLLQAQKKYGVDMNNSWLIGDKEDDISAANSSGIFNTILVRSGHKIDESRSKAKYFLDSIHESISVVSD
jgi:D-glycero-D-manno-heptose 1,7-bisphosphate phosphatase